MQVVTKYNKLSLVLVWVLVTRQCLNPTLNSFTSHASATGYQATNVNAILSTMNTVMQNAVLIQQLLRNQIK